MNEKIYKTMSSTGACSLTVGIIVLATGNRNRDHDDRKRCKTAEKEIRDIDIKGFRNRRKH
mgnify:CR=1 FL=1